MKTCYVDEAHGNDANTCLDSAHACKTMAEIAHRMSDYVLPISNGATGDITATSHAAPDVPWWVDTAVQAMDASVTALAFVIVICTLFGGLLSVKARPTCSCLLCAPRSLPILDDAQREAEAEVEELLRRNRL